MINQERLTELFLELVKTDSGSREERLLADLVTAKLEALGFAVEEDGAAALLGGTAGNLRARLPGTRPGTVLFSAHLDRVKPGKGIKPEIRAGVVYSDGTTILAADDCAGIAAILEGVQVLREKGAYPTVEVAFTVCEEVGLEGARHLDLSWFTATEAYVFDSDGPVGSATVQAPYQARFSATVIGKAAHAGVAPEEGINAIVVAGQALAKMPLGRIDPETTANIGLISGGEATNIVPPRCELTGEARSLNGKALESQLAAMRDALEAAAKAAGAQVEIAIERRYDGYNLELSAPVVTRFAKAVATLGLEPTYEKSGGGSDGNIFNQKGLPTLVAGIGYQAIHSTAEHISLEQLGQAARLVVALAEAD